MFILKKIISRVVVLSVVALALTSCSKSNSDKGDKVIVADTEVSGPLSSYFELVDKKYLYKKDLIDKVVVELKCLEAMPEGKNGHLAVVAMDDDDIILSSGKTDAWSFSDYSLLSNAKPGDIVTVTINNYNHVDRDKHVAKIRLISDIEEVAGGSFTYSAADDDDDKDDDSYSSESVSSVDVEEMLDSYEKYVDQYVKFAKRVSNGDMDAMEEYNDLMVQAQELSEKIENCKGEMNSAQLSRYTRITSKMVMLP